MIKGRRNNKDKQSPLKLISSQEEKKANIELLNKKAIEWGIIRENREGEYWHNLIGPTLLEKNLISDLDWSAFRDLCRYSAKVDERLKILEADGEVYISDGIRNGTQQKIRPELRQNDSDWEKVNKLRVHFCMTPLARKQFGSVGQSDLFKQETSYGNNLPKTDHRA